MKKLPLSDKFQPQKLELAVLAKIKLFKQLNTLIELKSKTCFEFDGITY